MSGAGLFWNVFLILTIIIIGPSYFWLLIRLHVFAILGGKNVNAR